MRQTIKMHEIACDANGCTEVYRYHGNAMAEARRRARAQGWASNALHDWCPEHR